MTHSQFLPTTVATNAQVIWAQHTTLFVGT